MKTENGSFEQKSIRYALGRHEDLNALACDCVGLANAVGGTIALGIEAGRDAPPAGQTVPSGMPEHLRKRLAQVTVNVATDIRLEHADNDAEWVHIRVLPSRQSIAATSDGRYFIRLADETHRLMPDELGRLLNERIALGLLAQIGTVTAIDLCRLLDLPASPALNPWLGRLPQWGVVKTRGQTKGMQYCVAPDLLRKLEFKGATTLKGIEAHRLRELIIEDLGIYRNAAIREIQTRIGAEIPIHRIRRVLEELVREGLVVTEGRKRWTRYTMTGGSE